MALTIKDLPIGAKVDIGLSVDGHKAWFEKLADNHYGKNEATLYPTHFLSRKAFDAKEPNNENEDRQKHGNNNVRLSNLMQWLNSEKKDWYVNQHDADQSPTSEYVSQRPYADEPGFLTYLQPQVRQYLIAVTRTAIEPSTDGGGTKNYEAKAFPLSRTEIGLGNEREADGKPFPQFDSDESRIATRIGTTSKEWYWLSTPYASDTSLVRYVHSDGSLSSDIASSGSRGVRPALTFVNDTPVRKIGDNEYEVPYNKPPTITLGVKDNETYYEGSTLNISGTATDADVGDAVIVKYKLASSRERVITTQVSTGESFDYGKVLTFTKGRFHDGETVVTDVLAEGNTYTLEVWAQDDKGATSPIQKRKFTVVPNRSPLLEITETPNTEGAALSTDLSIKGTVNDLDGDDVRLTYKLNNGKEIPIAESDGMFEVDFKLSDLKQGRNTFLVIARDEYDAMTTREVQVTTTAVKSSTDHIENKLYYTIDTKGVETDGILVWLRRPIGDDTDYKGYLSITQTGAVEDYQAMDKTTSIVQGHKRDELIGSVGEKGADVRLKLEFDGDEAPIQMLQGVIK